jgi:four helix bundle suffix protein
VHPPRASQEELLADDRDFLRVRGLLEWPADHAYARRLRELDRVPDATYATFRNGIGIEDPAISTNVAIGLIRVTSYLLDRRIRHLEEAFIKEGGLRERMTRARLRERGR